MENCNTHGLGKNQSQNFYVQIESRLTEEQAAIVRAINCSTSPIDEDLARQLDLNCKGVNHPHPLDKRGIQSDLF